MIEYYVGNLIEAAQTGDVDVIGHQANCYCAMGAGIAPQIADAFPDALAADNETIPGDMEKMGTHTYGTHQQDNGNTLSIFNLYGQRAPSTSEIATDYDALRSAMESMKVLLLESDVIGFPKLGCGLAGGDWSVVSDIIEDVFDGYEVRVYVLEASEIPDTDESDERNRYRAVVL